MIIKLILLIFFNKIFQNRECSLQVGSITNRARRLHCNNRSDCSKYIIPLDMRELQHVKQLMYFTIVKGAKADIYCLSNTV